MSIRALITLALGLATTSAALAAPPSRLAPPYSAEQYAAICAAGPDALEASLIQGFEQLRTTLGDLYEMMPEADRAELVRIHRAAAEAHAVSRELETAEAAIWRRFKAHPSYVPFLIRQREEKLVTSGGRIELHDNSMFGAECVTSQVLCGNRPGFRLDGMLTLNGHIWGGTIRLHLHQGPENFAEGILQPQVDVVLPDGVAGVNMHGRDVFRIRGFVQRVFVLGCNRSSARSWQPTRPESTRFEADPRTRTSL